MIKGIGSAGAGQVDAARAQAAQRGAAPKLPDAADPSAGAAPVSPAVQLAAAGAPVDTDKVAAVRTAIAAGRYVIDPQAIADRMIALDLPTAG